MGQIKNIKLHIVTDIKFPNIHKRINYKMSAELREQYIQRAKAAATADGRLAHGVESLKARQNLFTHTYNHGYVCMSNAADVKAIKYMNPVFAGVVGVVMATYGMWQLGKFKKN